MHRDLFCMGDLRFKARWRSNESRARFSEIARETDGKRVRGDDKEHLASARKFLPRLVGVLLVSRIVSLSVLATVCIKVKKDYIFSVL